MGKRQSTRALRQRIQPTRHLSNIGAHDHDEVIVSIKDRGTGIDPDIRDKLFSKFATKSDTGSGLGLYISKGIVEAHDGRIWAENNSDGKGATLAFSLPINKENNVIPHSKVNQLDNIMSNNRIYI